MKNSKTLVVILVLLFFPFGFSQGIEEEASPEELEIEELSIEAESDESTPEISTQEDTVEPSASEEEASADTSEEPEDSASENADDSEVEATSQPAINLETADDSMDTKTQEETINLNDIPTPLYKDGVPVVGPIEKIEERKANFSVFLGLGVSVSQLDLEFDDVGRFQNQNIPILDGDADSSFHFAMNLGIKYSIWDYFAIGAELFYYNTPFEDFEVTTNQVIARSSDLGNVHTLSILFFVEGRYPTESFTPYVRLGWGVNINIEDFDTELAEVDRAELALSASIGAEIPITEKLDFFIEGRYHYNDGRFDLRPTDDNTSILTADADFSTIAVLLGLDFEL